MRSVLGALLAALIMSSTSGARADSKIVDKDFHLILTSEQLEEIVVLEDLHGHYLAVSKPGSSVNLLYYGDASSLHLVSLRGSLFNTSLGNSWSFVSERLGPGASALEASTAMDSWSMRCGERRTELRVADDKIRDEILRGEFRPKKWQRYPYFLSRDNRGIYYYIDDLPGDDHDMHLYIGRPGKMRLQALSYVVSDSEGDILFTKRGKLRIDGRYGREDRKASWIQGRRRTELIHLSERNDNRVIYDVLGVYTDVYLGNPCEDL